MDKTLALLLLLSPFAGFLFNIFFGKKVSKGISGAIGTITVLVSFLMSICFFAQLNQNGKPVEISLFEWISVHNFKLDFGLLLDQLSLLWLLFVTGIGSLIHLYSISYMHDDENMHKFFAYLNLFVFFMLILVLGANFTVLFIGWEGVGLCSYLLIGFWNQKNSYGDAARKAFIMNRIGDLGFLVGIFLLIQDFGTTDYHTIFAAIQSGDYTTDLSIIAFCLFIGAMGKSAQIPLFTWLPDAMAGPTPVSALIHAATMVTAGIYMIARSNILYTMAPATQTLVAIIGLSTAIFAATIALKQNDIKKVLAYSTVSQLGYMFLGLGVGAYTGAVFHVMTHAFFKALLFLGAGSVIHAMHHEQDITKMGGLKSKLPITHLTFLLGCIAIAGVPPFSGFFSKDEILMAAYATNPIFYYVGMGGALLTAFYMFRLYSLTFLGNFRGTAHQQEHLHESPIAMTLPLMVLAFFAVVAGFIGIPELFAPNAHALEHFLAPVFAGSTAIAHAHHIEHATEWILMGTATTIILIVIVYAVTKFKKYETAAPNTGIAKVLENKWYIDELYDTVIVNPLHWFAGFLKNTIEKYVIDGAVNGVGKLVGYGSRQFRLVQSGQVGSYILMMVMALVLFIIIWFNDNTIMRFIHKIF